LLGQGYIPRDAAILGVYLHGQAGDLATEASSEESLIAGDIIESLGNAFQYIKGIYDEDHF
jgi:NAD(P)H-hydrate epimerase